MGSVSPPSFRSFVVHRNCEGSLLTALSPDGRSPQEIVKQSVIEVSTRELFDLEGGGRKSKRNGALDGRMVVNPEGHGVLIFSTLIVESFV